MGLLRHYLQTEIVRLIDSDTRLTVIGRRDRLPDGLADDLADAEAATAAGAALHLRIALDYSSRDAILQAASAIRGEGALTRETFGRLVSGANAGSGGDVDLLIRPAARSACRISCCGSAPMRSSASPTGCGLTSMATILPPR